MKKIYIIIIEPSILGGVKHAKMLDALKKDAGIIRWWHHITNSYILITHSGTTAKSIQEFVKFFFNDNHFVVIEIPKINDYNGWLPQEAWTWIQENTLY